MDKGQEIGMENVMKTCEELERDIENLTRHIQQGEEFEKQGYDAAGFNAINYTILHLLQDELVEARKKIENG